MELLISVKTIDIILAFMVLEALGLIAYQRSTGRGVAPIPLLSNLLAGFFLMLALRSVLAGASSSWTASFLSIALLAHLADIKGRWTQ